RHEYLLSRRIRDSKDDFDSNKKGLTNKIRQPSDSTTTYCERPGEPPIRFSFASFLGMNFSGSILRKSGVTGKLTSFSGSMPRSSHLRGTSVLAFRPLKARSFRLSRATTASSYDRTCPVCRGRTLRTC